MTFGDCTRPPGLIASELTNITKMENLSIAKSDKMPTSLVDLLSNSLVMRETAPYLPVTAIHALLAVSKGLNATILQSPDTYRYLDLSPIKSATFDSSPIDAGGISWRSQRMDEALTEDEFYSGPLRGIMSKLLRLNVLSNVSTMVLDGLTVPTEIVREIISHDQYNVRVLSIREAKHLNERKLMQVLKYAVRPSRAYGTPKLRGLYVFGPMETRPGPPEPIIGRRRSPTRYPDSSPAGVMSALGAQLGAELNKQSQEALTADLSGVKDKWYQPTGKMFRKTLDEGWAETIKACEGLIHFDAVLCRGPRHNASNYAGQGSDAIPNPYNTFLAPQVAVVALGHGCEKCKTCPEGPARFGASPSHHLPLLAPPPLHSSLIRTAQHPQTKIPTLEPPPLFVRCAECLKHRWCERCGKWWDESCYMPVVRTDTQTKELVQWQVLSTEEAPKDEIKVHMGLCIENCLVGEMMAGAGSGGMWG